MRTRRLTVALLLLASCGDSSPETSSPVGAAVSSEGSDADPPLLVAIVELDPATRTGGVLDGCLAAGQSYEPVAGAAFQATTGKVEIRDDSGVTLASVPFLTSREEGGSMVLGPLGGFFDGDAPPAASRDAILLPYVAGAASAVVVVEGVDLDPLEGSGSIADLSACAGTTTD